MRGTMWTRDHMNWSRTSSTQLAFWQFLSVLMALIFSYHWCTIFPEPFALYALNETSLVRDISGNSNPNGIAYDVQDTDGPFLGEKSIVFKKKSTSYIRIGHSGELSMNASFSILAWIYTILWNPLDVYEGDIVSFSSHNNKVSGLVFKKALTSNTVFGRLYFPSSGQTVEVAKDFSNYANPIFGWWHHVALIYNYDTGYASLHTNGHVFEKSHRRYLGRSLQVI